jgi:predicted GIY-YIG superfamily endonuclease
VYCNWRYRPRRGVEEESKKAPKYYVIYIAVFKVSRRREHRELRVLRFSEIEESTIPRSPGVYVVCWVREDNVVPVPRILRVDKAGILYVGSTANLASRLKSFKYKHTLALTLLYTGLAEKISSKDLLVYYKTFNSKKEAEIQEALFLYEYTRLYGEPPPLNLKVGRQVLMVLNLGILGKSILTGELDPELTRLLTQS